MIQALRLPTDDELQAVARLWISAWGRQPADAEVAKRAETFRAELAGAEELRRVILVAGSADSPIGICRAWQDREAPGQWWLAGLVVDPACRRKGIGRALVEAALAHARERGVLILRCETHVDNTASIHFHEALGFVNEGEIVAPDGDRVVRFSQHLT